ncbi:ABC transporter ATP-binding protein [Devosia sp. 1635]|uniref:ABC transporter ATP-binding protein n=1 Tax=Devosia sp. 1635 TaxID=2726066 RepID=UPI001563641D|nr:ABC transporter ATP-binding protein [Devosia sp. 1635]
MIRLEQVSKTFPNSTRPAVDRVTLDVPEGEICVLLGPSGCGKTTTMKMVNRLIEPSLGEIFIGDKNTADYDPVQLRRTIGYVIQQIGLFPNKTIEDNICLVPDILGWERKKSRERAAELLDMVALDPGTFLKRYPKELSGGQQQRIGVLRAIAADPPVLLMDEPFGAIDPINREIIQDEFLKMQARIKKTIMFVSHDIDEAVKMADRIAIFRDGKLIQYDTPDSILAHPADSFVSEFLGGDRTLKRLQLLTVNDAMQHNPPRVTAEDALEKAASVMAENGHQSIVMVGPRGRARGYVQLSVARAGKGKVGENHETLPTTVKPGENLRTAVSTMFRHDVSWLACIDDDGIFKGYVTLRSITRMLSEAYRDG